MSEPVPYPTAARTLLHDTVMTAVDGLVRSRGWPATTMADVARAAGVSRQTLYNEFGGRQALVEAYVTREIATMMDAVDAAVREHAADANVALRRAFALFLRLASDEPVVQLIVAGSDRGELMPLLTDLGHALATDRVAVLITEVWPQVSTADGRLVAESLVRLAISHAILPTGDHREVAAGVSRMLAPFVTDLVEGPSRPVEPRR